MENKRAVSSDEPVSQQQRRKVAKSSAVKLVQAARFATSSSSRPSTPPPSPKPSTAVHKHSPSHERNVDIATRKMSGLTLSTSPATGGPVSTPSKTSEGHHGKQVNMPLFGTPSPGLPPHLRKMKQAVQHDVVAEQPASQAAASPAGGSSEALKAVKGNGVSLGMNLDRLSSDLSVKPVGTTTTTPATGESGDHDASSAEEQFKKEYARQMALLNELPEPSVPSAVHRSVSFDSLESIESEGPEVHNPPPAPTAVHRSMSFDSLESIESETPAVHSPPAEQMAKLQEPSANTSAIETRTSAPQQEATAPLVATQSPASAGHGSTLHPDRPPFTPKGDLALARMFHNKVTGQEYVPEPLPPHRDSRSSYGMDQSRYSRDPSPTRRYRPGKPRFEFTNRIGGYEVHPDWVGHEHEVVAHRPAAARESILGSHVYRGRPADGGPK